MAGIAFQREREQLIGDWDAYHSAVRIPHLAGSLKKSGE